MRITSDLASFIIIVGTLFTFMVLLSKTIKIIDLMRIHNESLTRSIYHLENDLYRTIDTLQGVYDERR